MFIGHFAVGFAAKRAAPQTSLGTLFLGAQLLDLLWPSLLLLGVERVEISPGITRLTPLDFTYYPWSHSLLMVYVWGLLLGADYYLVRHYRRGAIVVGLLVLSHWLLDLLVHRPDLPLYPGDSPLVGLGLWNFPVLAIVLEVGLFIMGVWLYHRGTLARDRIGLWGLWVLVAFLMLIYLGNLFGDPPPSVAAIGWVGQSQWLLVAWGYWIDRHRTVPAALSREGDT